MISLIRLFLIISLCLLSLQAAPKTSKKTDSKIYFIDLSKGVATQSTTARGADAHRAIDGNVNGVWNKKSTTHTANKTKQWWQVELKHSYPVTGVVLYNRSGPLQKRLTNFAIVLLDDQGQEVFRKAYHSEGSFVQKNEGFLINKEGIFAKVIRIELLGKKGVLSLAEVKATTSQKPLLPYKSLTFADVKRLDLSTAQATQSSTLYEAQASRVIDGNTDAYWSGKSVNHTDVAKQQWWQVKLAKQQTLTSVTIYNRASGEEPERMSNFAIILLNNKGKQVFKKIYHQDGSYIKGRQSFVLSSKGIKAQTIKIQQLGDTERSLSLAEVEVYGIPAK